MSSRSWLEEEPAHSLPFAQIKPEPTAIPDAAPEPAPLPARPPDPGRAEREVAYWQNRHQQARKGGEPWTRTYKASLRGFELFLTLYRLADGTLWGLYWVRTSQSQGTARQWPLRGKLLQDGSFHLEGTANSAKFHGRYNPDNTLSVGEFRRVRGERDSEENGETDDVVLEGLQLEPLTPMEPFRSLPSWAQGQEGEETAGTATTAPQAQPQAQPQQPKEETAPPAPQPRQPQPSPPPQPQPRQQAPQPPQASAGKAWSERHSFEGKLSAGNANVTIHFSEVFKKADGTLLGNFSTPSGNGHFFGTLEADGTVEFTAKYDTGKFQGQTRQFRNGRLSFSPGGKPKTLEGEWLGKDEEGKDTIYRLTAVWAPNRIPQPRASVTSSWIVDAWKANIGARGIPKTFTPEVAEAILWAAGELGVNPNDLAACIAFESKNSFSPSQPNLGGGSAVGLIQFTSDSIQRMREWLTTWASTRTLGKEIKADIQKYGWQVSKLSRDNLMRMSVQEQIRYVVLHFKSHKLPPGADLAQIYKSIIAPFAPNDEALYTKVANPDKYAENQGLDLNKDGAISKSEAVRKIHNNNHVLQYFLPVGNHEILQAALESLSGDDTEKHGYHCLKWVREVLEKTDYAKLYRPYRRETAKDAGLAFRTSPYWHEFDASKLQPGDIIFWLKGSFYTESNGQQKEGGHVGIYIGGGKVASNNVIDWNKSGKKDARGLQTIEALEDKAKGGPPDGFVRFSPEDLEREGEASQ